MSYLKLQDEIVLEFNVDSGFYKVYNNDLLPFALRDGILDTTKNEVSYRQIQQNYSLLMDFFANRTLSVKRENAKAILNSLHIAQTNDYTTKLKIIFLCKGLSITDDYWVTNNKEEKWADVNLRKNKLSEVLSYVALSGKTLTITGDIRIPELTAQGAYAKAWVRYNNNLFLLKASSKGGREAEVEVNVSKSVDHTNVPHVEYRLMDYKNMTVSACHSLTNNSRSIVPAYEVEAWCNRNNKNFIEFCKEIDKENFMKMQIVDYLLSNSDRHSGNWGFFVDNQTGKLLGIHDLFDHNNSFDEHELNDINGGDSLIFTGKTKKEIAKYAMRNCHFVIEPIKKIDEYFINDMQKKSFLEKANELGLDIYKNKKHMHNKKIYKNKENDKELEL